MIHELVHSTWRNVDFSNSFSRIGRRIPLWTQGQGSNLSEKIDQTLWIKPSGFRLDDVGSRGDLAQVDMPYLQAILQQMENDIPFHESLSNLQKIPPQYEQVYAEALKKMSLQDGQIRPSMETAFHVFFPHKYVYHFHALAGVLMAELFANKDGRFLSWISQYAKSFAVEVVPYCRPGLDLAFALKKSKDKNLLFLRNHGVLLAMQDLREFHQWEILEEQFWSDFFPQIHDFLQPDWIIHRWLPLRPLTPDFAVFCDPIKNYLKMRDDEWAWTQSLEQLGLEKTSAQKKHIQNLFEIWWAHGVLQTLMPSLPSLSDQDVAELVQLPTEQHRRSAQPKGGSHGSS